MRTATIKPSSEGLLKEIYLQLFEIKVQLEYLREKRLSIAIGDRLEELWDKMDAQEHKELAIELEDRNN